MKETAEGLLFRARFNGLDTLFGRMVLFSLLLHAAAAVPFLKPWHSGHGGAKVTYLDLNMAMAPQPSTAIADAKQVKPAAAKEVAPVEPLPATPAAPQSELDKLQENTRKSLDSGAAKPEAVEEASLGLSITSGYFSSIGAGETLRDDIRDYYFEMLRRINEKWWLNRDSRQGGRKGALFYLTIARDGAIVKRMMLESSGNPSLDRAMLQALEAANPLPPLPETYRGDFFQAPLRFNMPLNLLGAAGQSPYSISSISSSNNSTSS